MRVQNSSLALLGRRLLSSLGSAQQNSGASSLLAAAAAAAPAARNSLMLATTSTTSISSSVLSSAKSWSMPNCSCGFATATAAAPSAGAGSTFVPPPTAEPAAASASYGGGSAADDASAALSGRQRWHRRRQQLLERKQARREEQQQAKLAAAETQPRTGTSRRIGLPIGYKKLEFVLTLARRRHVDDALVQLAASPKRAALAVRGAVANARHNAIAAGADPARLFVERAWTGRATPLRRPWFHGRGYSSIRQSRRTHLTVVVQEAAQPLKPKTRVKLPASMRPRRERRHPRGGLSSPSLTATTEL